MKAAKNVITWAWPASTTIIYNNPVLAIHVLLVAYLAKNQLLINLLMLVWKSFLGNLAYLIVLNLEIKTLTKRCFSESYMYLHL
jgi:hypothetical protein